MTLELGDFERLKLQLRRVGEAPALANEELKLCAVLLQQKAKNMAPIDYSDLINAIQIRETAGQGANGRFVKGVRNFEVYINDKHPVADDRKHRAGVNTVGEYAWLVHEHMGWGSTPGSITIHGRPFMPNEGRNTGPNGEERGGRFLERAAHELEPLITARLARIVARHIKSLDI